MPKVVLVCLFFSRETNLFTLLIFFYYFFFIFRIYKSGSSEKKNCLTCSSERPCSSEHPMDFQMKEIIS